MNFNKCIDHTVLSRFATWGYLYAAEHMINPRRRWKKDREGAIKYLERVLLVLHVDPRMRKDAPLDPIIAEDVGGVEKLRLQVGRIEKCIALIKQGEDKRCAALLAEILQYWLQHALKRFIECYEGEIEPLEGVSTTPKLREIL